MTRWYMMISFTLVLLFCVVIFVRVEIGHGMKNTELAFAHFDDVIGRYSIQFLDIDAGIRLSLPVEGYWTKIAWSPNGRQLIVQELRANNINYVYLIDLYGETSLVAEGIDPVWLSEDSILVWNEREVGTFMVYSLNPLTLDTFSRNVFNLPCFEHRLSPDQRHLACLAQNTQGAYNLYLIDMVENQEPYLVAESAYIIDYDWSPDGTTLLYTAELELGPYIYLLDTETRGLHQLTFDADWAVSPGWSPVGIFSHPHIAFMTWTSRGRILHIMDENNNVREISLTELVRENIRSMGIIEWSLDGHYIIIGLGIRSDYHYDLFLVTLDDNPSVHRLTYNGHSYSPTWRP